MTPWRFKQGLPAITMHCRRELIAALDLIAACIIAQLFLDHWLAEVISQFHQSSIVQVLNLLPDRVQLSLLFTFGMMLLLGCGVVAGFAAAKLKIIFGRPPPGALLSDGVYGFHFFNGGIGFDSFPSSHAAMAAGIARAVSFIWPTHRRVFIALAVIVSASRFIIGAHYLSDALLGFAVGLGTVVLLQFLFSRCGIQLESKASAE